MENEHILDIETEETVETAPERDESQEETVTLSKKDFTKLNRKAFAYDSAKKSQNITNNSGGKQEIPEDIVRTVQELKEIEGKRQFGFENALSPEETDYVFKFSGGKPTKETLDHPFVSAGIESLRAKRRIEANTPSSSQRSSEFGGKKFEELSPDERQKAFEARMSGK